MQIADRPCTGATRMPRSAYTLACALPAFLATFFTLFLLSTATSLAATAPTVTIKPVGTVTSTTAQVSGTVNPNGGPTTLWNFEYSKDPETEGWTASAVSGMALAAEEVSGTLEGLQPNASYQVRLVATNEEGGEGVSAEPNPSFTTKPAPPTIVSENASYLNPSEIRLEGAVNPNNQLTECHFQYGEASVTEHTQPCEPELIKGFGQNTVQTTVGLAPRATYSYRVILKNGSSEETIGATQTVTPAPTPTTEAATEATATAAVLHGTLNAGEAASEAGSYQFVYARGSECEPSGKPEGTTPSTATGGHAEPVSATVEGLDSGTHYTFCLLAQNTPGEATLGAPQSFTTLNQAPLISAESVSGVASEGATLNGQIETHGEAVTYHFEYGTSETYSSSTPETTLTAGQGKVAVTAQITDTLAPETTYHYRLVSTNPAHEVADGTDATFTTRPVADTSLPDDRGYEMVSPAINGEGDVYEPYIHGVNPGSGNTAVTALPFQAAAGGDALAYPAEASVTGGTGLLGTGGGNEFLSTRNPAGGWTATNIEEPAVNLKETGYFEAFSPNLEVGILDWDGKAPLAPGAPSGNYNVLYARNNLDDSYTPLMTTPPPVPLHFESNNVYTDRTQKAEGRGLAYAGSSSNMEHILFEANQVLTPEAQADPGSLSENDLYDSVNGVLRSVNVLPGQSSVTPDASFGAPSTEYSLGKVNAPDFDHVISANGSRIFWSTVETVEEPKIPNRISEQPKALYVRENDASPGARTVQLDASTLPGTEQEKAEKGGGGRFWAASSDGSRVFFTDCKRLTVHSTAVVTPEACEHTPYVDIGRPVFSGADLYEYDLETGGLVDLTVDAGGDPLGADVQGVLATSEDGSYVYFAAGGVLAPGAQLQTCEEGGACNLYVIHDGSPPRFIATISAADNEVTPNSEFNERDSDWQPSLGFRAAEATPDGSHLVFSSAANLTAYDSHGHQEVYVYSATGAGGLGSLSCASCQPSGEPPANALGSANQDWAAYLPVSDSNTYQHRWISADGTKVFFTDGEGLVPRDKNGKLDVYEWEQAGSGSCTHGDAYNAGCVYLLSAGTSEDNSFLLDASETGGDVFIETRSHLVEAGQGEEFAVYDARVGVPQPLAPVACSGSGCQGTPPPPPVFATPSSVTFNGVGNFPPPSVASAEGLVRAKPKSAPKGCKKDFVKKKNRCVRKRKSKKSKKANRGAGQ